MTGTEHTQREGLKSAVAAAFRVFARDCSGTTAMEYAIVAAALSAAVVTGVTALAGGLETLYKPIAGLIR